MRIVKNVVVEILRLIFVVLVGLAVIPTAGLAAVDCTVVTRIERINTTIRYLRGDPIGELAPYNQVVLVNDLKVLSTRDATKALSDHTDQADINQLVNLVSMAHNAASGIPEKTIPQFALSLRTDYWSTLLDDSTNALSHMPCGDILGKLPGDAEGREIDGTTVERRAIEAKERVVEKPVQTAIFSILMVVAIVFATRHAIVWLRNRSVLRRRRSKRFATQIPSHLAVGKTVFEAEILDLSCHGTKIRYWHTEAIKSDIPVGIHIEGEWRMGTLVWSNALYIGIRFDRKLPIPLVRKLANSSRTDGLGRAVPDKEKAATA